MTRDIHKLSRSYIESFSLPRLRQERHQAGRLLHDRPRDLGEKLGLGWNGNMCITCIETRIGREMTAEEVGFGLAPGIQGYPKSDLLLTRAGFGEQLRKQREKAKRRRPRRRRRCSHNRRAFFSAILSKRRIATGRDSGAFCPDIQSSTSASSSGGNRLRSAARRY